VLLPEPLGDGQEATGMDLFIETEPMEIIPSLRHAQAKIVLFTTKIKRAMISALSVEDITSDKIR